MPTCVRCGFDFPDGPAACPSCGLPIPDLSPQTTMYDPSQDPPLEPPQDQNEQPQSQDGAPQGQYGQPQSQYGVPQGQYGQPQGTSSPLNMSTVSLLGMFFGMFGLHRFYMGKNVSGIFMILTLGGLGMWSIIDVIWSFAGKFHDKNGLPINVSRPIDTGIILIPIIIMAIMYSFYIIAVIAMIIATDNY